MKPRMFQAIITKYHGPTNSVGSRISATAAAGRIYMHRDDSLGVEENHIAAATLLAQKFGWEGQYYGGGMPSESGYVFVCADDAPSLSIAIDKAA